MIIKMLILISLVMYMTKSSCSLGDSYIIKNKLVKSQLQDFIGKIDKECGIAKSEIIYLEITQVRGFISIESTHLKSKKIQRSNKEIYYIEGFNCVVLLEIENKLLKFIQYSNEIEFHLTYYDEQKKFHEDDNESFHYYLLKDSIIYNEQIEIICY